MTTQATLEAHQSLSGESLPGCWKLEAGRALTMRPRASGVLRIAYGRVWVTMDTLHDDAQAAGDLFLVPGRGLVVQAGQRVVIESAGTDRQAPAYFSWDPLGQTQAQAVRGALRGAGWQIAVAQPVRDIGLALGQATAAVGRLVLGVAGLAAGPVTARLPWQRSRRATC
ncbi:DUF2917 domain-containing protein [Pseudorhodoferax sp. Leaf267]|uniref:DUF2917 domain-containing protein n=1 Tax=Pseudorhodoferax sp. Leaf267 TaxID=1736316 RepID=UPI0006F2F7B3|nr:DUF2917 domain-containing protein [Pseudorhodoferax sp. Leaf267]KQP13620.1 hypothetical protein ASF43_17060 [Pseudorhodoferax sp. Leaf267]